MSQVEYLTLPIGVRAPATAPAIDPDKAWARLYASYWEHSDAWTIFAVGLINAGERRLMKRFFRETWYPKYAAMLEYGNQLGGTADQKLATIRRFGAALMAVREVANQINLPTPALNNSTDLDWFWVVYPPVEVRGELADQHPFGPDHHHHNPRRLQRHPEEHVMNSPDPWRSVVGGPHHGGGGGGHHGGGGGGGGHHGGHRPARQFVDSGWGSPYQYYPYWDYGRGGDTYNYYAADENEPVAYDRWGRPINRYGRLVMSGGHHGGGGGGGGHHGGGGGGHHGGHHHGHHHHQQQFGGGWGYPYQYPYWGYGGGDTYNYYAADENEAVAYDRWGRPINRYGRLVMSGEPPPPRTGLLAEVAPVIAPATGGITAAFDLDAAHRLTARVTVDGKTYQGTVDLAPAITALLAKFAQYHRGLHAQQPLALPPPGVSVGGGDCGARLYHSVTVEIVNAILKKLVEQGSDITGNNPWKVVTHNHGVELRGTWYREAKKLLVEVTGSDIIVPCDSVWSTLDPMLTSLGATSTPSPVPSSNQAIAAIDRAIAAARAALVDSLVQQHVDTVSSGWFDSLKKAASKAVHYGEEYAEKRLHLPHGSIGSTLKKYKGPISSAAGLAAGSAATVFGGPAAGLVANKLANKLVLAAAGDGSAKQALTEARTEAQRDPKLAKALGSAEKAVAQTTAAYHIAETARAAGAGDPDAATEINKLAVAAQKGDKAAQIAMQLANKAADTGHPAPQAPQAPAPEAPVDPWAHTAATSSGDYDDDALSGYRAVAVRAVNDAWHKRGAPRDATSLGYRRDGKRQKVYFFGSRDEAEAWWFRSAIGYDYLAVFDAAEVASKGERSTPLRDQTGMISVSGEPHDPYRRHAVIRIPVINEDGILTKRRAIYPTPGKRPNYYQESTHGNAWWFEDPMGDVIITETDVEGTPGTPFVLGQRFRLVYPQYEVLVMVAGSDWVGTGGPRVEIIGAEQDTVRKQAADAAKDYPGRVIGAVRWADGNWHLEPFKSTDDADDWFGSVTGVPSMFTYAAYYDKADATFPRPLNEAFGHPRAPKLPGTPIPRGVAQVS
jgi:hypothetical protein